MSLTLPQSFRSPKDDSTAPQQDAAVSERTIFVPPTSKEVEEAEADMIAAGLIVEILVDELENARKYQREARDKYIAMCGKVVRQ